MGKMESVMTYFAIGEECDFCGETPKVTIELKGMDEGRPFCWHICLACLQSFLSTIFWWERGKEQRDALEKDAFEEKEEAADDGGEGGAVDEGSI